MSKQQSLRLRLAKTILGSRAKEFIPALNPDGGVFYGAAGRLKDYASKQEQIEANIGWSFAANNAIVEPSASVQFKLYKKQKDGDREEIKTHEILDLLDAPNFVHTGEQMRQLHYTYMNFVGESYIFMRKGSDPFIPSKGQLPDALDIFPAHAVQFKLGATYTTSTVKLGGTEYPITAFIRDLNPDPENPYNGRSIIKAASMTIDTENQMKAWNRNVFANNARPSLVFTTNENMTAEAYERWKQQFNDETTGTDNAYKPLLVEKGDVKPYMLNQQDLDFLASRKFSMTEILSMWRVSPDLLGQMTSAIRANLDGAFYINSMLNVVPRVRQFTKQLNASLVSVYDPMLELDFVNPVPEDIEAMLKQATAGVDKWLTKDEVRDMYGEKPLPDDLGTHIIVLGKGAPLTLEEVVAGEDVDPPAPAPGPDADPKPADKSLDGVKKKRLARKGKLKQCACCVGSGYHEGIDDWCWNCDGSGVCFPDEEKLPIPCYTVTRADDVAQAVTDQRTKTGNAKVSRYRQAADMYEGQMAAALATQFNAQKTQILANLDYARIGQKGYTKKDWLQDLIDWAEATANMNAAIKPLIHSVLITAGQDATQSLGLEASMFDSFTPAIMEYFQDRSVKIASDVDDETEKQLRASLSDGILQGESTNQLRARVESVMGSASTMRADRIARTEVTRAQGYGDIQAWSQSGVVTGKEWFTAEDEHVCAFCESLDGTTYGLNSNVFSKGDSLTIGSQTQSYNYDDVPSPPLHPNCRCTLLPIM